MQITHFLILFISVKTLDTDQPKLGKKMFAYNKYAKFYNLEPYGTTVSNNFQMEIQIFSSTKSFSLKNWKMESNWYISFKNSIIDHIDKMNREEKQRKQ